MKHEDALRELRRVRVTVERFVEGLIRTLDHIDAATEDLEDADEDQTGECEPSLASTEDVNQDKAWLPDKYHCGWDLETD